MRYYVLTAATGDEVVRVGNGSAAYFDAVAGRWITDPLLALEVRMNGDWRQVEAFELPYGVIDVPRDGLHGRRKSRTVRRGRHSRK